MLIPKVCAPSPTIPFQLPVFILKDAHSDVYASKGPNPNSYRRGDCYWALLLGPLSVHLMWSSDEAGTISVLILQLRKVRLKGAKWLPGWAGMVLRPALGPPSFQGFLTFSGQCLRILALYEVIWAHPCEESQNLMNFLTLQLLKHQLDALSLLSPLRNLTVGRDP